MFRPLLLLMALVGAAGCGAPVSPEPAPSPGRPPAGTIVGLVRVQLHEPSPEPAPNVFVYVKEGLAGRTFPVPANPVVLDQISFQFVPRVFGIRPGQTLRITSQDASQHNVFCQPFKNKGFNESMFGGEAVEKTFAIPEVMILLQCNIHHIMKAYAGVVDHPFFAVTGRDGTFEIRGLPPGRYTLAAWQEFHGNRVVEVELDDRQGARIDFTFP